MVLEPKNTWGYQELKDKDPVLREIGPCQHLDFRLAASRAMTE